ncbi:(Fe-S)-binding protein [Chryseobacterium sp. Ch-15]|uniref:(Fe-S)-binding protein n=1 Tax=Chryseobacterium muglaense TaxID=2893752 RepID=A0A9Q3UY23_9FLAO|nr:MULTISPECIES: (Fe-S)-binding protein [Chryseobacterium]MBD3904255.1 (Fe-S)-binding protein [Chryseobacterium muglaense]MBO6186336.1 (Fe-S)-binding protein [Chryseobacterium sp.]MCC9035429.1 (Fe-S)-binding protein [Chryseobacterium muglaense]MCM2553906.1 (Fe-S)-binding protein [Chryseobacterium muglaense]
MQYLDNVFFLILLIAGFGLFGKSLLKIYRNIRLGREINRSDRKSERWETMAKVAMGQSRMSARPVAGVLHLFVYVGFVIINIELIEIIVDGIFGTHRFLSTIFGHTFYNFFTATLEVLALLVIVGVVLFFIRRNFYGVKRLTMKELFGWPKNDANWILIIEFALMVAFFTMNSSDFILQQRGVLAAHGSFPISEMTLVPFLEIFSFDNIFLEVVERGAWWFHFIGILFFMNYLYYSKHLHIILAFPSTWYANLDLYGKFNNLESVTKEIKLMMDPNADPYAAPAEGAEEAPSKFGAEDVFDLNQVQLLNAYSCTECGRCTSVCPANITGKKLSPRAILMKTRDRIEEVGRNIDKNGKFEDDGKKLLNDYISKEELWACTTCNACTQACPILLDPLSIIFEMRRFLVMEQSAAPQELNLMMTNVENNAAPWQYNQADRLNWAKD